MVSPRILGILTRPVIRGIQGMAKSSIFGFNLSSLFGYALSDFTLGKVTQGPIPSIPGIRGIQVIQVC